MSRQYFCRPPRSENDAHIGRTIDDRLHANDSRILPFAQNFDARTYATPSLGGTPQFVDKVLHDAWNRIRSVNMMNVARRRLSNGDLFAWSAVGVLCAELAAVVVALARNNPHYEGTYTGYLVENALNAGFFLVLGSPITVALEVGWARFARSSPAIERNWPRRMLGLTIATYAVSALVLILSLLLDDFTSQAAPSLALFWDRLRTNLRDLFFLCNLFCVAVTMPRLLLRRLRLPIFR